MSELSGCCGSSRTDAPHHGTLTRAAGNLAHGAVWSGSFMGDQLTTARDELVDVIAEAHKAHRECGYWKPIDNPTPEELEMGLHTYFRQCSCGREGERFVPHFANAVLTALVENRQIVARWLEANND